MKYSAVAYREFAKRVFGGKVSIRLRRSDPEEPITNILLRLGQHRDDLPAGVVSEELSWGVGQAVKMVYLYDETICFLAKLTVNGNGPAVILEPLVYLPFYRESYDMVIDIPQLHINARWTVDPMVRRCDAFEIPGHQFPSEVGVRHPVGITVKVDLFKSQAV